MSEKVTIDKEFYCSGWKENCHYAMEELEALINSGLFSMVIGGGESLDLDLSNLFLLYVSRKEKMMCFESIQTQIDVKKEASLNYRKKEIGDGVLYWSSDFVRGSLYGLDA